MSESQKITDTVMVENTEHASTVDERHNSSLIDNELEEYHMSWRTGIAVAALSLVFGATTYGITGPNFSIANMVQTFPNEAKNAVWVSSAGLLTTVTVPNAVGTTSDRFGKKWFLAVGCFLGVIGACVSGSAKNLSTVIGGQAISGVGSSIAIVSVAAGMEVVPAKYRPLVFAIMAGLNGILGAVGGPFIFAACIQHNVGGVNGWRFGFYIQAILFGTSLVGLLTCYHPPPTRFRREQSGTELLKSLDYIGIMSLTLGFALIVVALIWGGNSYPWSNAHVISLLVVGPVVVILFLLYEWKGRPDGILNHGFFESRNFPILLLFGAVDGMLLYGMSQFVPNEIRAIYTTVPVDAARIFTFNGGFLTLGYIVCGIVVTKLRRFKVVLIITNLLTTVFVGLMARSTPYNKRYFEGIISAIGFLTAANTVVPVGVIALVVPPHLMATSNLLLSSVRVIGGLLGLSIFSIVYNNKATSLIPRAVLPVLKAGGLPEESYSKIIGILFQSPQALAQDPAISPQLLGQILTTTAKASSECYKYVWYCIMGAAAACLIASFFLKDVPERMTNQVETVLEYQDTEKKQVDDV